MATKQEPAFFEVPAEFWLSLVYLSPSPVVTTIGFIALFFIMGIAREHMEYPPKEAHASTSILRVQSGPLGYSQF